MRKMFIALLAALTVASAAAMFGCGGTESDPDVSGGDNSQTQTGTGDGQDQTGTGDKTEKLDYDMSGVTWNYTSPFTYDGEEKSITVSGLPQGVTVKAYSHNSATNAGTYTATVSFNYDSENYNEPTVAPCNWVISKADITGLSLAGDTVEYDGQKHSLAVTGTLPEGTTATYTYNNVQTDGVTQADNYEVTVVVSGANYNTWTATAILKITPRISDIAQTVIDSFGTVPDIMNFFPQAYQRSNHVLTAPITYYSAVSVSSLPKNGIGKQLHTVYNSLQYTDLALGYVSTLYGGFSAIVNLYQAYINNNPDNYKLFEGTWSGFAIKIEITDNEYSIMAKATGVAIEIYQSTGTDKTTARIDIAEKASVKFENDGGHVRVAVNAVNLFTSDIELVEDANTGTVTGVLYETTGVGDKRLTTCTILTITQDNLIVVGNKGDFAVPGQGVNVEVYDNDTGNLCGTEVYEDVKLVSYDTLWYNLGDIRGITSVSATMSVSPEDNKLNKDTIYVNGSSSAFVPEFNSVLGVKTSRQYDIEFKTMYFYEYNEADESYELVEQLIPMLFVQRDNLNTYLDDIETNNGITVANTSSAADNAVIAAAYESFVPLYEEVKKALSYEMTIAFIGNRDSWFDDVQAA